MPCLLKELFNLRGAWNCKLFFLFCLSFFFRLAQLVDLLLGGADKRRLFCHLRHPFSSAIFFCCYWWCFLGCSVSRLRLWWRIRLLCLVFCRWLCRRLTFGRFLLLTPEKNSLQLLDKSKVKGYHTSLVFKANHLTYSMQCLSKETQKEHYI